jgi:hypothetical protein
MRWPVHRQSDAVQRQQHREVGESTAVLGSAFATPRRHRLAWRVGRVVPELVRETAAALLNSWLTFNTASAFSCALPTAVSECGLSPTSPLEASDPNAAASSAVTTRGARASINRSRATECRLHRSCHVACSLGIAR